MHPMLQMTIGSGAIAILIALITPLVPARYRKAELVLCLIAVFYLTLWRGTHSTRQINLLPFWSYRKWHAADVRWQIYMNIFLFIPYGAILKSLNIKRPVLIAAFTSVMIELLQLVFCLGMCETDDVINNSLGAVAGCLIYWIADKGMRKIKEALQ